MRGHLIEKISLKAQFVEDGTITNYHNRSQLITMWGRSVELTPVLFSYLPLSVLFLFLLPVTFHMFHYPSNTQYITDPPLWKGITFFIWMPGLPYSSEQANISLSVFHDGAKVVLLKVLTLFWDFYYTSRVVGVWIWDRLNIQNLHLSWTFLYEERKRICHIWVSFCKIGKMSVSCHLKK